MRNCASMDCLGCGREKLVRPWMVEVAVVECAVLGRGEYWLFNCWGFFVVESLLADDMLEALRCDNRVPDGDLWRNRGRAASLLILVVPLYSETWY